MNKKVEKLIEEVKERILKLEDQIIESRERNEVEELHKLEKTKEFYEDYLTEKICNGY